MNKRELKLDKYGISSSRYKELCGFCEQYPEWQDELLKLDPLSRNTSNDTPVQTSGTSDKTASIAMKRAEIYQNSNLIELIAKEASSDLYPYIIKSVCFREPYWYLKDIMQMPCERSAFYDARRYFFYLLDKRKHEHQKDVIKA